MASNQIQSGSIVTYEIKVNGKSIPDESRIFAIRVHHGVNQIPTANITLLDGDVSTGKFEASSSTTFVPGAEVVIEAGYDLSNTLIFKGIITKQNIRIDAVVGSTLEIECRDEAIGMTVGRKSRTYYKQKDSAIMTSMIRAYSELSSNVTETNTILPEQVQYYATDWNFLLTRAEANGLIVVIQNGKVTVQQPHADTNSVFTLTYGDNLLAFNSELNAVNQLGSVKAQAWDYKIQAIISAEASSGNAGAGNLTTKELSDVVGLTEFDLQSSAYQSVEELKDWAKAQMVKSESAKIIATAKCQGTSSVAPGRYLMLSGVGDRFNGDHLISGVTHEISDGNWTTEMNLGLPSIWYSEEPEVMAPSASGLLPGARGLFNGTVKKMYEDPDSQYRILVDIPLFDQNGEGIWARLSSVYASSGAGMFFLPEVGDEVVLGFLSEDPRYPVILGSLYSNSKNKPHDGLDPNEKNSLKAIVSKSGIQIEFDDENKVLSIVTPGQNTVILSDQDKKITLEDQNSNRIIMSESGITIKSSKDLNLEAEQNINIKGSTGVKVESSAGDVETRGLNVKVNADIQYSAEGNATASVKGGAQLTLEGAMIMIN